jgi:hypothetical protein
VLGFLKTAIRAGLEKDLTWLPRRTALCRSTPTPGVRLSQDGALDACESVGGDFPYADSQLTVPAPCAGERYRGPADAPVNSGHPLVIQANDLLDARGKAKVT